MLRPATDADVDAIRAWRNHPEVRALSLTQDEIDAESHARWWAGLHGDQSRQVLIYERGGTPCGVVTFFDIAEADGGKRAMWGYYLDNAGLGERGELLPAWMQIQREAVRYADSELNLEVLGGEVLDQNEAVRRMNTRNGFVEIGSDEREIGGKPTTVHLIERRRPARD